jgi:diguanylate cyclase (GGDEF)-like protein/PAS domain S-box-containing protein
VKGGIGKVGILLVKKLQTSELRYRRLFETAQDGILILNAETGAITDVNPFLVDMLGYTREEFIGKRLWEVGAFKDIEASKDAFLKLQKNEYIRYKDLPLKAKEGQLFQVEFVSNVYWEGDAKVIQCNIRDVTERKKALDDMREQSVRDILTGLFNRRYMEETLSRELLRASREKLSLGMIMLDVDDFKQFNDNHGHAAGDAILRELGRFLLEHIRGEDVACRYGGDEFIIILPGASKERTRERAELFSEHAQHLNIKFKKRPLGTLAFSFGIAVFPEDGSTSDALLSVADDALYRAKSSGHGAVDAAG